MTAVSNEGTYHVDDNAIYNMKHYHTHTHRIYDTTFINNIIMTKVIRCMKRAKLLGFNHCEKVCMVYEFLVPSTIAFYSIFQILYFPESNVLGSRLP